MGEGEHEIHRGLKNRIKEILKKSGFKVDSEIHVSFSRSFTDDFSLDVCAIHDDQLVLIECKKSDKNLTREIEHTLKNGSKLNKITKIISSDDSKFSLNNYKNVSEVHYCYAINETNGKEQSIQKKLAKEGIIFWNKEAVRYFYSTSKILGSVAKFEILREMEIKPQIVSQPDDAVRIVQNGQELFLLGIQPYKLLEMTYAFRRTSFRDESYQRILSNIKLEQLDKFYKNSRDFLLANSVIIAFDDDTAIQNELVWNRNGDRKLHFPTSYCCAWMIDGQHRVYAFKDTKYSDPTKVESKKFKLPVVAFRKLPLHKQSRSFVNINYYQTKINTVLICDLASSFPDARYELSWVSLLVKKLSTMEPWKGKIQTSQTEPKGVISIAGFIRPVFLYYLLGYDVRTEGYTGPLFEIKKFNKKRSMEKGNNKKALDTHLKILKSFFKSVKKNSWNDNDQKLMWDEDKKYGLVGTWGVNALLLVLYAILKEEKKVITDFDNYLAVLKNMDFSRAYIKTLPRGYGAYNTLAENILNKINQNLGTNYSV